MPYKVYIFNLCNIEKLFFLSFIFFHYSLSSIETGNYPYLKRLNNGNYIILSSTKIIFADSTLTTSINEYNFGRDIYNSNEGNIGSTTVTQFNSTNDGYIIAVLNQELFIFSSNGAYMKNISIPFIFAKYTISVIPNHHSGNDYYFTLIYATTESGAESEICQYLVLRSGTFNPFEKTINIGQPVQYAASLYASMSCDIMLDNNQEKIACFYGSSSYFVCTIYDQNYQTLTQTHYDIYLDPHFFKSAILQNDKKRAIICGYNPGESLNCFNFDISKTGFTNRREIVKSGKCRSSPTSLIVEYFYETEEFIIGCLGPSADYYILKANNNLTIDEKENHFNISSNQTRINIILPEGQPSYIVYGYNLTEPVNLEINIKNNYPITEPVSTDLNFTNFYNYNHTQCLDEIPDGYYCNNTQEKTIDKCHENCKTCSRSGTDQNNNCETCHDTGKSYYNLGNCLSESECTNGIFIDSDSIKKCKCLSNEKCLLCNNASNQNDLCESCNYGYYPKLNDESNKDGYYKCYNSFTIGNGYYLNTKSNFYEPCINDSFSEYKEGEESKCQLRENELDYVSYSINVNILNELVNSLTMKYADNYISDNIVYRQENELHIVYIYKKLSCFKIMINEVPQIDYEECHKKVLLNSGINDDLIITLVIIKDSQNTKPNTKVFFSNPLNGQLLKDCEEDKETFCPEESPYLIKGKDICSNNCSLSELFNSICITNNPKLYLKQNIIDNIRNSMTSESMSDLLKNVTEKGEDLYILDEQVKFQITSSSNQNNKEYDDISTIKLGECENKLKKFYNINEDEDLLIFKSDIYYEGLLSPIVIYELYHPTTKIRLDLILCQDVQINITVPVKINENDLYKHDPTNKFYNDICYSYTSEKGTDITLNDRQDEFIDKNLSLCESGCNYTSYDSKNQKVVCNCMTKLDLPLIKDIKIDKELLKKNFLDLKSLINLNVIKCFTELFSKKGLKKNLGSYIILSVIFIFIISYNVFFLVEYDMLVDKIEQIIEYKINRQKQPNNKDINLQKSDSNKDINNNNNILLKESDKSITKQEKKNSISKCINKINKDLKGNKNEPQKKKKKKKINDKDKENESSNKAKSQLQLNSKNNFIISNHINNLINITDGNNKNNIEQFNTNSNNEKNNIISFNDYEINNMTYKEALIYDKRTYFQYYLSLLRTKHIVLFAFIRSNDYNSTINKISLLAFSFSLYITINALFYTDSTIHKIYKEEGSYNFIYQLPQILYSTIISSLFYTIIKFLSLSEKNVLKLKNEENIADIKSKKKRLFKILKIKFIWFFNISLVFLIFFWYYLGCFCAVYKNTQIHLVKDTLISFTLSLLYPFALNLLPGVFRIPSLKNNNKKCNYQISKILQLI